MKIEIIDIVVAVLAVFFLAAFIQLKTEAFLYVVILLVLAEAFAIFWERRKKAVE